MSKDNQMDFFFDETVSIPPGDEHLEKAFRYFHKNNPFVWRYFRTEVLTAYNDGEREISAFDIMRRIRKKCYADYRFARYYRDIFTGNHQELAHIFIDQDEDTPKSERI